jgi:xanthine dehydrogenase accessory factor
MDLDILRTIVERPERCVLATSVDVKGSSPRHPGAKMLLGETGCLLGTIGGGKGEACGLEACRRSLESGRPELLRVEMLGTNVAGTEMICGGIHTILIEPVDRIEPYRIVLEHLAKGESMLLVKRITPPSEGPSTVDVAVFDRNGTPVHGTAKGLDARSVVELLNAGQPRFDEADGIYFEPVFPKEKLLILGGGHVGRTLAAAALPLGFQITVVDDRPDVLAEGQMPEGVRTITAAWEQAIAQFPCDASTYAVVVTRSHLLDLECLRALMKREYRYAGFMGSSRKTRFLLDRLLEDGVDPARVDALWGPVGLDIGAETPEELAIAILGEIVAVRRNTSSLPQLRRAQATRRAGSARQDR